MGDAYVVVMAGGSGTRFWPLSRKGRPKQLLALAGTDESLLRATVRRLGRVAAPERVLVVTGDALAEATAADVPDVPRANVLAEPVGRNTAPCVAWAAAHVRRRDPAGVLAVLPADHHVTNEPAYVAVIERAIEAARGGSLVTVGIRPTRAETGYGYVEVGAETSPGIHRAKRFVEKPDRERAEEFLRAGTFLWNSGMFFFRADRVLERFRADLPAILDAVEQFDDAARAGAGAERAAVERLYPTLQSISIDHGIMEKAPDVLVVPGDFGWSDLGSYATAWELAPKDARGNAARGDAILVDASRCYVNAPAGKVVALVGVEDLVVVDTEDALLVMPRERAQDVRAVVEALKARGDLGRL